MKRLQRNDIKILSGKFVNECISIAARLKLSKHDDGTWHKNKLRSNIMNVIAALGVDVEADLPMKL